MHRGCANTKTAGQTNMTNKHDTTTSTHHICEQSRCTIIAPGQSTTEPTARDQQQAQGEYEGGCENRRRVRAVRAQATNLVDNAPRGLCGCSVGGCCGSRCLILRLCVMSAPRRGTSTVDGHIWEAREVLGSHQMGMHCRCGVLAMIWGSE